MSDNFRRSDRAIPQQIAEQERERLRQVLNDHAAKPVVRTDAINRLRSDSPVAPLDRNPGTVTPRDAALLAVGQDIRDMRESGFKKKYEASLGEEVALAAGRVMPHERYVQIRRLLDAAGFI